MSRREITVCDQCDKRADKSPDSLYVTGATTTETVYDFCRYLCLARWARAQHLATRKPRPRRPVKTGLALLPTEAELPTPSELHGMIPDFTGDLSTEEHLRRLRGGRAADMVAHGSSDQGSSPAPMPPSPQEPQEEAPPKRKRGRPKRIAASVQTSVLNPPQRGDTHGEPGSTKGSGLGTGVLEPCPHCGESLTGNRILSDHGDGKGLQQTCLSCMKPIGKEEPAR